FAVALKPFLGPHVETPKHAHEGPLLMWLGPALLATLGLFGGILSSATHRFISTPMASAVAGEPTLVEITTIPHIGMPLLLSIVTVAFGVLVYLKLDQARDLMVRVLAAIGSGPDRGFDHFVSGLVRISVAVTRV